MLLFVRRMFTGYAVLELILNYTIEYGTAKSVVELSVTVNDVRLRVCASSVSVICN